VVGIFLERLYECPWPAAGYENGGGPFRLSLFC
jgi:hypothetical protein